MAPAARKLELAHAISAAGVGRRKCKLTEHADPQSAERAKAALRQVRGDGL